MAKSWKPSKLDPRVDFDPVRFRKLFFHKGSNCLWQQAARCPCVTLIRYRAGDQRRPTNEPQPNCPACGGIGYFYRTAGETIVAIVLGASRTPLFYQLYGEHARGMANISFLPEHMARGWDRITVIDTVIPFDEVETRIDATDQAMRYPIKPKILELARTELRETELKETSSDGVFIYRADSDGRIDTEALVRDTDYAIVNVNAGTDKPYAGVVRWLSGARAPGVGDRFAITYWANPVYVINDTPHPHRDTPVAKKQPGKVPQWRHLPIQQHAWLEHYGPPHGFG